MVVMKFGGTSVGKPESMIKCAEIVERELNLGGDIPLVVVSAYSKITDLLLTAAEKSVKGDIEAPYAAVAKRHTDILNGLGLPEDIGQKNLVELHDLLNGIHMVKEVTPRLYDYVASFGERLSSKTFAALLRKRGIAKAEAINAYDLGYISDSHFMKARPLPESYDRIAAEYAKHKGKLLVVTGFIAKDKNGDITTNGRSGSDFSAAVFGAGVGVKEIQVWKDVPGVMSADPTLIGSAQPLPRLSFAEASELAYYGAEVLHPATMVPAMRRDIPVRVKYTFDPEVDGTLITPDGVVDPERPVKSVVYKEDQTLINVRSERMLGMEGFMARLFNVFEKNAIVIDMISTSEVSISLTTDITDEDKLSALRADLDDMAKVDIQRDKCIVAIVGEGMKHSVGLAARATKAFAATNVSLQMISQGASEINITFLIDNKEIPQTIKSLHKEFFGA